MRWVSRPLSMNYAWPLWGVQKGLHIGYSYGKIEILVAVMWHYTQGANVQSFRTFVLVIRFVFRNNIE